MESENKTEEKEVKKVYPAKVTSEKGKQCKKKICEIWNKNKKTLIAIFVLIVLVAGGLGFRAYWKKVDVGQDIVKQKIQAFVDKNAPQGIKVEIKDTVKEGDLYKVTIDINGQSVPLYVTRDGKKLIQQVIELDVKEEPQPQVKTTKTEPEQKLDIPEVELFVMSYCPYGTQIEKGILPVVKLLGDKIKFNLKFVDYAMHGKVEIDENLRQYCIEKTQPTKLVSYLECFLKKGQGTENACLKTAGVNTAQITSCISATEKQFNINDSSADSDSSYPPFGVNAEDNAKYGVQGSPTLVINGTTVSTPRDPASLLKMICSGFNNAPEECSQTLASAVPSSGFGEGTTAGASAQADCEN